VIDLISSVNSSSTIVVICDNLSKLVRNLAVTQSYLPLLIRIILHPPATRMGVGLGAGLDRGPVGEERFVYLEEGLLVVDEEVEEVALVAHGEVAQLHSALCQLGQPQERLLELPRLLSVLFYLLKLLLVVDFVLKPSFHYILADLFYAVNE
jgi:hypothetical protein